jgi:hypothetical protein
MKFEKKYVLYKMPISLDTLYIVQYLYFHGISMQPDTIIERKYPSYVTELPTIECDGVLYKGLDECVRFYETESQVQDLISLSHAFKIKNPRYTIKA